MFGILIFALISWGQNVMLGALTTLAFALGALTSILSGYIGMKGIYSFIRTKKYPILNKIWSLIPTQRHFYLQLQFMRMCVRRLIAFRPQDSREVRFESKFDRIRIFYDFCLDDSAYLLHTFCSFFYFYFYFNFYFYLNFYFCFY